MDGHENDADNKATDNSGAQGIFSTPELTVDTEKLAQNSNSNQRSRVASIFANTDAGQRSQKLDDAMGLNNIAPAQVTEDIKIDNGPRKRSKAPIIIAAIALFVVVIGITVWMVMKNVASTQEMQSTLSDAKKQFDQYATYILFGESKDELSGEYQKGTAYYLDEKIEEDDNDSSFWETADSLLQQAVKSYDSLDDKSEILTTHLASMQENFFFLSSYQKYVDPSEQQLITSYMRSGKESAEVYIENYFHDYSESEFEIFKNFATEKESYYNNYLEYVGAFIDAGCINNNQPVLPCDNLYSSQEEYDGLLDNTNNMTQAVNNIDSLVLSTINSIEKSCWVINSLFAEELAYEE